MAQVIQKIYRLCYVRDNILYFTDDFNNCLGNDHDNEGYCVFDGGLAQADDEREEISKRVYFLEQLELEMAEK